MSNQVENNGKAVRAEEKGKRRGRLMVIIQLPGHCHTAEPQDQKMEGEEH